MDVMNQVTKEKLAKTVERMQKALAYNDQDYMSELVHDLAEFAYFAGYKEAQNTKPVKKSKKTNFTPITPGTVEAKISTLINKMGIPMHIKGHRYLIDAIALTYENPILISKLTQEWYPFIANKYNTTSNRVERAIRHSIKVGWSRVNPETISMIRGGIPVNKTTVEPTNSEFIHLLSIYICSHHEKTTSNDSTDMQLNEKQQMNKF